MNVKASALKEKLNIAITEALARFKMDDSIPKTAFTRERILPVRVMAKALLGMGRRYCTGTGQTEHKCNQGGILTAEEKAFMDVI